MKSLFESGNASKNRESKKIDPRSDLNAAPGSGVYENEPEQRPDVIRESDLIPEFEISLMDKGIAKNMVNKFKTGNVGDQKASKKKGPVKLYDENTAEPVMSENQPKQRQDVVREEDDAEDVQPRVGYTKNLADKFLNKKDSAPKKRVIRLVENEDEGPIVYENNPEERQDVVKSGTKNWGTDDLESGRTQNMAGYWANYKEESKVEKQKVVIDREGGPVILENEPEQGLEGVVRGDDPDNNVVHVQAGHARGLATRFLNMEQDKDIPRERKPIKLVEDGAEPIILENEPEVLEGVVRSDAFVQPSELIDTVKSKNLHSMWQQAEGEQHLPQTARAKGGAPKPQWLLEIEAAQQQSMQAMNDEDEEEEDDEEYIPEQTVVPQNKAKNLRAMWNNRDQDDEEPKATPAEVNKPRRFIAQPTPKKPAEPEQPVKKTHRSPLRV
eukprot:GHVU01026960.1.p1 GENE.GHVU01026960.1~~GHVU01026960.1.p1  ORF type:complete len:441 (+),score=82.06 GHVU01026960.1:358-1680(+)